MLRDGIITDDNESQTMRIWIHSAQASRSYPCVSLLDGGSLQSFILQLAWDHMILSGDAIIRTTPARKKKRRWGRFGNDKRLSTPAHDSLSNSRVIMNPQWLSLCEPT